MRRASFASSIVLRAAFSLKLTEHSINFPKAWRSKDIRLVPRALGSLLRLSAVIPRRILLQYERCYSLIFRLVPILDPSVYKAKLLARQRTLTSVLGKGERHHDHWREACKERHVQGVEACL